MVKDNLRKQYRFLMWGGGIFLVVIGIGILLLVSFIIGEAMILLYPYLNETVLLVLKIFGWVYVIPGIILFILGFWAGRLAEHGIEKETKDTKLPRIALRYIRIFAIITSILLIIAFPIGTFIGLTLLRESWMLQDQQFPNSEERSFDKEKINNTN